MDANNQLDLTPYGVERTVDVPLPGLLPNVPARDSKYVFQPKYTSPILRWWFANNRTRSLSLIGPTRCGKTSVITQICALLNWPAYVVPVHGDMRPDEFEGSMTMDFEKGKSEFQLSLALTAYKHGGCLVLDEGNRASPALLTYINAMAELRPLPVIATGEIIEPHPMFRLVMCGNAGSAGDMTGRYVDSASFCVSFASRFRTIQFEYPDADTQAALLEAYAGELSQDLRDNLIRVTDSLRTLSERGDSQGRTVRVPFSLGTLMDWACAMVDEYADATVGEAFDVCYLSSLDDESERVAVTEAVKLVAPMLLSERVTPAKPNKPRSTVEPKAEVRSTPDIMNADNWIVMADHVNRDGALWMIHASGEVSETFYVTTAWGKSGGTLQYRQARYGSEKSAALQRDTAADKKRAKGYTDCSPSQAQQAVADLLARIELDEKGMAA